MMTESSPACCIVFTTDSQYLFPTLVSSMQARRHASPEKAAVIIFCIDMDPHTREVFGPICEREGIDLRSVPSPVIEHQTAMLARLFLNRFVPAQFTQYLYLDGDVQVHGSLDPLIDVEVPPGHFMAANDPITFLLADRGKFSRDLASHMRSLALTEEQAHGYFNSGVLRIAREGWDEIGSRAWQFFQHSGTSRRFPDQDALNVVGLGHRLPLALAWNYPVFFANARVAKQIQPRITHFMSSPKPWQGHFSPWTREACQPYSDALATYPSLRSFHRPMPFRRKCVYALQQQVKRCQEILTWGFSRRRQRVLHYEQGCVSALAQS
jgi:lipopolysaccharide biosynthesis glycosyltransferase